MRYDYITFENEFENNMTLAMWDDFLKKVTVDIISSGGNLKADLYYAIGNKINHENFEGKDLSALCHKIKLHLLINTIVINKDINSLINANNAIFNDDKKCVRIILGD